MNKIVFTAFFIFIIFGCNTTTNNAVSKPETITNNIVKKVHPDLGLDMSITWITYRDSIDPKVKRFPDAGLSYKGSDGSFKNFIKLPYSKILRDPKSYAGTVCFIKGEVLEFEQYDNNYSRFLITTKYVDYVGYYGNAVWVCNKGTSRVVKGDIVTIFGVCCGIKEYQTASNNENTVPLIAANGILIEKEASDND